MMTRTLMLTALPAVLLAGCTTIPQGSDSPDGFAAFGQTTTAGQVKVRPEKLVEDSRCPMNARCIWAGRVVVDGSVWVDGQKYPARLTLGEPFAIAGGAVVLDSVEPSRSTQDGAIPVEAYRFHFDFR